VSGQFDRLRPRPGAAAPASRRRPSDPEGKHALFGLETLPTRPPLVATVTVDCSACQATTVLTPRQALLAALPSLHLPLFKRDHWSWLRCPACGRRTWVRLGLRW
jgi:hypothetical protein